MKQITHFRLLYGVIIVLTTCLLLVGGAYRVKTREANALREAWQQATVKLNAQQSGADARGDLRIPVEVWEQKKQRIRDLEARLQSYQHTYPLAQEPEPSKSVSGKVESDGWGYPASGR